jgi:hypothetical protein
MSMRTHETCRYLRRRAHDSVHPGQRTWTILEQGITTEKYSERRSKRGGHRWAGNTWA